MKTFKDWAGQEIIYEFVYETLHEDTDEKEFTCYIKPDNDWLALGTGKTKEIALNNAIQEWNILDSERG